MLALLLQAGHEAILPLRGLSRRPRRAMTSIKYPCARPPLPAASWNVTLAIVHSTDRQTAAKPHFVASLRRRYFKLAPRAVASHLRHGQGPQPCLSGFCVVIASFPLPLPVAAVIAAIAAIAAIAVAAVRSDKPYPGTWGADRMRMGIDSTDPPRFTYSMFIKYVLQNSEGRSVISHDPQGPRLRPIKVSETPPTKRARRLTRKHAMFST